MKWFSKIDEGEQRPENQKKSNCLISQISKLASYFVKKFKIFRFSKHGAILIEFAVCIPILIIAMLYIHDIVKIRRYYSQTEFAGQQMINIIQNISQKRTKKLITQQDLKLGIYLASLSFYPGKFMFSSDTNSEGLISPCTAITNLKGAINEKAQIGSSKLVFAYYSWGNKGYYPNIRPFSFNCNASCDFSVLRSRFLPWEEKPTNIWPTLKIQNGEEKAIIETFIAIDSEPGIAEKIDLKKIFGLFLLNPKNSGYSLGKFILFPSVLIFKPRRGLFEFYGWPDGGWYPYTPGSWYDDYDNWSYEDRLDFEKTDEWIQFIQGL
ncbi:MAG: hypothetical protein K5766_02005 [Alphaproteobacteria bacterium]|nr:hypothetical protein [Alphaproteobacteria bacterium]